MSWDAYGIARFGIDPEVYESMSHLLQSASILGSLGSVSVLATGGMFYKTMVRNKVYMKILLAMSVCDFFGSFPRIFGYANKLAENDDICAFEAWTWYCFNRASWFYTFWMSVTLLTHVTYGKIFVTFFWINVYTWGLNLLLLFLPLW